MPVDWSSITDCLIPIAGEDAVTIKCFEAVFKNLVLVAASLAGIVFFIMLLVGGFRYLTSSGDAKKVEQAKGTITAGFLGIILIVAAYIVLVLIKKFTGVDVTNFVIQIQ